MKDFVYSYPTKVYFGEKAAAKALPAELAKTGKKVMLAYGGGSVKRSGVYDEICGYLKEAGKEIVDFPGIMPNPTYKKVQEGAALAREQGVDFILAVGGGSVIDCCKIIAAQAVTDQDIWGMEFKHHIFPTSYLPMGAVVTPAGTGAENLASALENGYKLLGAGAAMLLSYALDRKYIHFDTAAPLAAQVLKCVIGLALVMAIRAGLKSPFYALFGAGGVADAARYFITVFFAAAVWPMTFPPFGRIGAGK